MKMLRKIIPYILILQLILSAVPAYADETITHGKTWNWTLHDKRVNTENASSTWNIMSSSGNEVLLTGTTIITLTSDTSAQIHTSTMDTKVSGVNLSYPDKTIYVEWEAPPASFPSDDDILYLKYSSSEGTHIIGNMGKEPGVIRTHGPENIVEAHKRESSPTSGGTFCYVSNFSSHTGPLYYNIRIYSGGLSVDVIYEYRRTAASETRDRNIDLYCFITDAQYKDMEGLSVTAELIDITDLEQTVQQSVKLVTNSRGLVSTSFSVPEQIEIPAIRLTSSLNAVDSDNNVLFHIIDDADEISKENKAMQISTTVFLSFDEFKLLNDGVTVMKYVGLSFANLISEGTWEYSGTDCNIELEPSISVVLTNGNSKSTVELTAERRMADASIFYTTAYDAYMLAADLLGEEERMHSAVISIRLRSQNAEDPEMQSCHFDPQDITIHHTNIGSLPDDSGIFIILHEFGHAVDYVTNGFEFRTPLNTDYDTDWHGGFLNSDMNGSFGEGFATFYAALVKAYYGYPSPEVLDNINIGPQLSYFVYNNNGFYEELAVATFLYHAHFMLGGLNNTWKALGPDREHFSDYYDAIIDCAKNADGLLADPSDIVDCIRNTAIDLGLYTMPYAGNGVYDEGEPYVDENGDGKWNEGERYCDLIFEWTTDSSGLYAVVSGYQDPKAWQKHKDSLVAGPACDYERAGIRKTIAWPKTGYLAVQGVAPVEYVLVTVRPKNGPVTTALRNARCGIVFMVDPLMYSEGTVTVQIPGGGVIFESDLNTLAQKAMSAAPFEPLAISYVSSEQFADDDVLPVPTYGAENASGTIHKKTLSQNDIDMLITERLTHKDEELTDRMQQSDTDETRQSDANETRQGDTDETRQGVSENRPSDNGESDSRRNSNEDDISKDFLLIAVIGAVLVVVVVIVIIARKKKK